MYISSMQHLIKLLSYKISHCSAESTCYAITNVISNARYKVFKYCEAIRAGKIMSHGVHHNKEGTLGLSMAATEWSNTHDCTYGCGGELHYWGG